MRVPPAHSPYPHAVLQRGFGGVLVVLLGLELLDTLKAYFSEHHIRVEVIIVVAMIAVGRHIIQLDFEHGSHWHSDGELRCDR